MPERYIKYKSLRFSLPEAAFNSITVLAQREDKTPANYIAALVEREIIKNNLPLFCAVAEIKAPDQRAAQTESMEQKTEGEN